MVYDDNDIMDWISFSVKENENESSQQVLLYAMYHNVLPYFENTETIMFF